VEDCTSGWPVPPRAVFRARLCLAELAGNVVEHGGAAAREAPITVALATGPDGIAVAISDAGAPFDPTRPPVAPAPALADTTPSGRGLLTVHRLAAALAYTREDGRNHLRFRIASD
jgi:serine/threonine-protein kinase RsbW